MSSLQVGSGSSAVGTSIIFSGPDLAEPIPALSIPDMVRARARTADRATRTAIVDGVSGRSYTFAQIDHLIGRFAAGLAALGFRSGDTLLMLCPNQPEWPVASLGAMAAGGIVSGANPLYGVKELAHQMRDAKAKVVFTVPAFLATAQAAAKEADCGCKQFIVLGDAGNAEQWQAGVYSYAQVIACTDAEPIPTINVDSIAALPYSSGTTGLSKGVMLSHRNLVSNVLQYIGAGDFKETDVTLIVSPMFHIMGFSVGLLVGLTVGYTIVTLPRFEPEQFLQTIQNYKVTVTGGSPPLLQFLAMSPLLAQYDVTSLNRLGCGAAPMGAPLQLQVSERLNCRVGQGYGMTESSGCIASTHPGRIKPGSCGQILPHTQVRIVHTETGADLALHETGEIWFKGPQVFKGYLNNAVASGAMIGTDDWARTGDIGHVDEDNHVYVTDRLKELIKVKGFQVAPAELEAILFSHPAVGDCAVIGRADERAGEVPVAYVVRRGDINEVEVQDWLNAQVVEYKKLRAVVFCESIPKNPTGKILRRVLREKDSGQ